MAKNLVAHPQAPKRLKLWAIGLACLLSACATPTERIERRAAHLGLTPLTLKANGFPLRAFFTPGASGRSVLHVYIEGDGAAWRRREVYEIDGSCAKEQAGSCGHWRVRHEIPEDPTSRQPVMLRLIELDDAPRLYLGRPCYMGFAATPPCGPELWSFQRYSPAVVDTMTNALRGFLAQHPYQKIAWLGHSGGGTLAMLLARQFPETISVITLAGNLDVAAWSAHHNYTPLTGSMDPAREAPLASHIVQRHYLGAADKVITAQMVAAAVAAQPGAVLEILPDVDHNHGWQHHWPAILSSLRTIEESLVTPAPPPTAPDTGL